MVVGPKIGIQKKQKKLTKTSMMISNWENPLISMIYTTFLQRCKGFCYLPSHCSVSHLRYCRRLWRWRYHRFPCRSWPDTSCPRRSTHCPPPAWPPLATPHSVPRVSFPDPGRGSGYSGTSGPRAQDGMWYMYTPDAAVTSTAAGHNTLSCDLCLL